MGWRHSVPLALSALPIDRGGAQGAVGVNNRPKPQLAAPIRGCASALAKQGQLEGYAVGGCCDLSTSVHHLVDKLGTELGYLMSKDTGYDVEDCITLATKGLKLRVARRVWRDYYRHPFARQHCADPSTEGLADQQRRRRISEEDSRRDEQERAKNHEFWAWKARNLSAWAPRGMG